jgi:subtilisin
MRRVQSLALVAALVVVLCATWMLSGCSGSSVQSAGATNTQPPAATGSTAAPAAAQPMIVVFKTSPGVAPAAVTKVAGVVKRSFTIIPAVSADLTPEAVAALRADPTVAYIEPDVVAHATADAVYWDMTNVGATRVWPTGNTGTGVKVGIIDTGIDYNHPDLAAAYKGGYNFVANNSKPLDDNGHGTHVAGTIAAVVNGTGIEGVAPSASLYALKALDASGSGYFSAIIAALQWAATNKMQVVNMSLGASQGSRALQSACDAAYTAGVLLVAAAGNSGTKKGNTNTVEYPAAYTSVIAVSAVDSTNTRASWSSTGAKVELAAPGVSITSDKLGGGLVVMSGTSMACPHVVGVAALVFAAKAQTATAARAKLDNSATDLGTAGRDWLYGLGLVNAVKAVAP